MSTKRKTEVATTVAKKEVSKKKESSFTITTLNNQFFRANIKGMVALGSISYVNGNYFRINGINDEDWSGDAIGFSNINGKTISSTDLAKRGITSFKLLTEKEYMIKDSSELQDLLHVHKR